MTIKNYFNEQTELQKMPFWISKNGLKSVKFFPSSGFFRTSRHILLLLLFALESSFYEKSSGLIERVRVIEIWKGETFRGGGGSITMSIHM